ncbi:HAD hydrolase-like protein [Lysinibacillus xylanilyticus]|uniref:HAD hydrolase-like protein n=1 Tax=Lysinibacillus xylanilyticus TaxID=582475 RepID=UPI00382EEE41
MIGAVIFDLDGTLLDRDSSVRSFSRHQYEQLKPSLSHIFKENYVQRCIGPDNYGYTLVRNVL